MVMVWRYARSRVQSPQEPILYLLEPVIQKSKSKLPPYSKREKNEVFVSTAELNTSKRELFTPLRINAKLRFNAHCHLIERSNYGKWLEHWV